MDAQDEDKRKPRPRQEKRCLCSQCAIYIHRDDETELFVPGLMIHEDLFREHARESFRKRESSRDTVPFVSSLRHGAPPSLAPVPFEVQRSAQGGFETSVINAVTTAMASKLTFKNAGSVDAPSFVYDPTLSSFDPADFFILKDTMDNQRFVHSEGRLNQLAGLCGRGTDDITIRRQQLVDNSRAALKDHKRKEWERNHTVLGDGLVISSDHLFRPYRVRPLAVQLFSLVLLLARFFQKVPEKSLRLFALGFRVAVACLAARQESITDISTEMPLDPQTHAHDYNLQSELKIFVNCPRCSALYPCNDPAKPIPDKCGSTMEDPSSPCNANLFRRVFVKGKPRELPYLKYAHHPYSAWLARMLSRADIEPYLEDYKASEPSSNARDPGTNVEMNDIWDSPLWWSFANGFMKSDQSGVLKLLFGFGLDGFNPFHNLTAKQSRQDTAIYLVLFNLPPHLRYLPENIYLVGVIPGHPSTHLINQYLDLVMDDFLEAWFGYKFTRTYLYPLGRKTKSAILLVICDMLAARQVTGFPSATSMHFCINCDLTIRNIHSIDPSTWPQRNWAQLKREAEHWRNLPSKKDRDEIFKVDTQIRWSSLNRLPYWDPVKCTPPEAMHFDLLNNIENFVRHVWQVNVDVEGGDGGAPILKFQRPPEEDLDAALELLNNSSSDEAFRQKASSLPKDILSTICYDNQLPFGGRKAELVDTLCEIHALEPLAVLRKVHDPDDDVRGLSQRSETPQTQQAQDSQSSSNPTDTTPIPATESTPLPSTQDKEIQKARFHAQVKETFISGSCTTSMLNKVLISVLKAWAQEYGVNVSGQTKSEIVASLLGYMKKEFTPQASHVLGKDLMEEIRQDQLLSLYPLGLNRPPAHWGTKTHGKLSADQWGVVASVSLVVTLVRCWGYSDSISSAAISIKQQNAQQRKLCMLYNFIDLVKASLMAHNRVTSERHADSYRHYIHRFFENAAKLYPTFSVKPAGHISLHFDGFLRTLGPSHSYKVPGFERMNFEMQSTKTNRKLGDMEITYLEHHCTRAALAGVVNSLSCLAQKADEPLRRMAADIVNHGGEILGEFNKERLRNNLGLRSASENVKRSEGLSGHHERLRNIQEPTDVGGMLQSTQGTLPGIASLNSFDWPKIIVNGQEYNAHDHQPWACYAVVENSDGEIRAALIRRILQNLQDGRSTIVIICQLFLSIDDLKDMYRELGVGFLVQRNPDPTYFHMGMGSIKSSAVLTPVNILGHEALHILPHNRMRAPFPIEDDFPPLPRYSHLGLKRDGGEIADTDDGDRQDKRPRTAKE